MTKGLIDSTKKQRNHYQITGRYVNLGKALTLLIMGLGSSSRAHFEFVLKVPNQTGRKEMFYLTTHSTHFIYGYMASDIWLTTILIVRKETRCRHIGYSFRLAARVLLYAPSHRQDSTYHGLCYTSRGALGQSSSICQKQTC